MAVPPDVLQRKPEDESGNTWRYPPTAMVHMTRDRRTALGVAEMSKALTEQVGTVNIELCLLLMPPGACRLTLHTYALLGGF